MIATEDSSATIIDGLVEWQRRQGLLETFRDVTHRALLADVGGGARDLLVAWGFPPPSLPSLDLGYFPDPEFVAGALGGGGATHARTAALGLLDAQWSGRVTGPWRNRHGRILTFFAFDPGAACAADRYLCARGVCPSTLFGMGRSIRHLVVVEGLFDVLLASCLGARDVVGIAGPFDWLSSIRLEALVAGGLRELTLLPPDTEAGRLGVLTVLKNASDLAEGAITVLITDPDLTAGARDVGELVRRRGARGLVDARSDRVDGDMYKLLMAPWGAFT